MKKMTKGVPLHKAIATGATKEEWKRANNK